MLTSNHGCVSVRIAYHPIWIWVNSWQVSQLEDSEPAYHPTCAPVNSGCFASTQFSSLLVLTFPHFQLVLWGDVTAGRHGPPDV